MSVSKELAVIQLTISYIKNDNPEKLTNALVALPIEKLARAESLMSSLLKVASGYNRPIMTKIILEAFKRTFTETDRTSLLTKLFTMPQINIQTLAFVVRAHNDYTFMICMDELIHWDSGPETEMATIKADKIFGKQSHYIYESVAKISKEYGNTKVEEFALRAGEKVAPYADIPEWVGSYIQLTRDGEQIPPTDENLDRYAEERWDQQPVFQLPDNEKAVELLTAGLVEQGVELDQMSEIRDYLMEKLTNSTRIEKLALISPILENQAKSVLAGEKELFQIYGPANPLVDQDLTLSGPSYKYGGCRMFLTDIFDYDEEFDQVQPWFTGACDMCHLRIRKYCHAIRRPRVLGGWYGCYCSFKCLRDSLIPEEPLLLDNAMINEFEDEFKTLGIQERYIDPKK